MGLSVDDIRSCLEGGVPALLATCSADGVPNVTYVSQVHRLDAAHVALSFQFFNKTRENVLVNPQATAEVIEPRSAARFRLHLRYRRTELEGALFESMKAKLSGIASHTGMSGIFKLQGADVYEVLDIEPLSNPALPPAACSRNLLPGLRRVSERMAAQTRLDALLDAMLQELDTALGIGHAIVLLCEPDQRKLYTVATRGYPRSGAGAEVPFGAGVIGVAAEQRAPIRIAYMSAEYGYGRAVRDAALAHGMAESLETEIPFPGMPSPHSQLAVPIVTGDDLLGVLYVESPEDQRFGYDEEDALVTLACQLASMLRTLREDAADDEAPAAEPQPEALRDQPPTTVRHYRHDHSVFVGDAYLIKGVAGAILWKLLNVHVADGRVDFSNRELRLDPSLQLPEIVDNLEARLILLRKRLAERCGYLRIEPTGRGRFRLRVGRVLRLEDQD